MKIIYGPKGTGKTKAIIESANQALDMAKGHVIYVTDTARYSYDLNNQIRYLDVTGFDIVGEDGFRGFIKGLVAANGDNEYIYIQMLCVYSFVGSIIPQSGQDCKRNFGKSLDFIFGDFKFNFHQKPPKTSFVTVYYKKCQKAN